MVNAVHAAETTVNADANQFAGPILVESNGPRPAYFDISIVGSSFVGTITTQRKRVGEADAAYRDIKDYASIDDEETGTVSGRWYIRIGCKTGNFTSGSAVVSVSI